MTDFLINQKKNFNKVPIKALYNKLLFINNFILKTLKKFDIINSKVYNKEILTMIINEKTEKILELLEDDCMMSLEQMATLAGIEAAEAAALIDELKDKKIILKNRTVINWEKTDKEFVTAQIALNVVPQRGEGFDKIAERIYKFPEVQSLYLMAGQYDLLVTIGGKTMKEVAQFVANRLATLEFVTGTSTHFVLKKYKEQGVIFDDNEIDDRQVITL